MKVQYSPNGANAEKIVAPKPVAPRKYITLNIWLMAGQY
jgi:hypothetical protein